MKNQPGDTKTYVAAGACLVLVALLYHIPTGDSVYGDAVHSITAAVAALCCLAWRGSGKTQTSRTRYLPAICALCLFAAAASVVVPVCLDAPLFSSEGPVVAAAATLLMSCLGTAIWEEALFRGLGLEAFAVGLKDEKAGMVKAAAASSVLFACLHLGSAEAELGSVVRFAQVALFGMAMCGVVSGKGGFVAAVFVHAAYDVICFMPALAAYGAADAEALMTLETSLSGMAASLAFLVPAAVLALRALSRS